MARLADVYVLLAQVAPSLEEARELLEEGVAAGERAIPGFIYAQALAAFARRGDDATSRVLRVEAQKLNPRVPAAYLTGCKRLPEPRPDYFVFDEESEAVDYAAGAGELWASVPGALAWLESRAGRSPTPSMQHPPEPCLATRICHRLRQLVSPQR